MTIAESSPGVTVGTSNNNNGQPGSGAATEPIASETRAHARARPTLPDDQSDGYEGLPRLWWDEAKRTGLKLSGWLEGNAFLREHPPSFASRFAYARQAPMAGHSKVLRTVQRLDAYTIGNAGVGAAYVLAWIWDRPLRRYVAIAVVVLAWLLH